MRPIATKAVRSKPLPGKPRGAHSQSGVSAVEALVAVPLLLMVGLMTLQFGLLFHARQSLHLAVLEAARSASVDHAQTSAAERGFARGLVPYLYGAADPAEYLVNQVRAQAHVKLGVLAGWIQIERISPTPASFLDWGQVALDERGLALPGIREIPHDNLAYRLRTAKPASGIAARRGEEAVGLQSEQTLADANLHKLQVTYGVPASVPLAGRLLSWSLRTWHGCQWSGEKRLGTVTLPSYFPTLPADPKRCLAYGLVAGGPRIPVTLAATIRMQSAARP